MGQMVILLDDVFHEKIRSAAKERNMTLKSLVVNSLNKYLSFDPEKRETSIETSFNYKCADCGHAWLSRLVDREPKCCPACKSYTWSPNSSAAKQDELCALNRKCQVNMIPGDAIARVLGVSTDEYRAYIRGEQPVTDEILDRLKSWMEKEKVGVLKVDKMTMGLSDDEMPYFEPPDYEAGEEPDPCNLRLKFDILLSNSDLTTEEIITVLELDEESAANFRRVVAGEIEPKQAGLDYMREKLQPIVEQKKSTVKLF